jgi:hypothetical protein
MFFFVFGINKRANSHNKDAEHYNDKGIHSCNFHFQSSFVGVIQTADVKMKYLSFADKLNADKLKRKKTILSKDAAS